MGRTMSTTANITNQTEILARCLDLSADRLTAETARFLIDLELGDEDRQRLNYLAEKTRLGTLSEAEQSELDEYRRIGRLVEMMKLKAKLFLKNDKQSSARNG